ncbi:MAG: choice-of-anchor B family protein [Candidatus Eisenbacteria bacterium]|nr:choice-of-anchor B family protein [Candidatus Latescibacterota bacterium]MBD3301330.1 choice-of-anchor B family protein [Candidatus Eisenbacteria bacterium]
MRRNSTPWPMLCAIGVLACLSLTVPSGAAPTHDDPKIHDEQNPYEGPGHRGAALSPDQTGRILDTFPASGVELLGWVPLGELPGGSTRANDITGYVSPSGREYAVIGLAKGTGFVEVTDPLDPQVVGVIPGEESIWRDMKTHGEFAFAVHDLPRHGEQTGNGIQVIDLRQIDAGQVQLIREVNDLGLITSHNIALDPASGTAYLAGSNYGGPPLSNGGLIAVDLSDPENPTFDGTTIWDETYVHDVLVTTYQSGPYAGREIAFAAAGPAGLIIIDVTDKSNMTTLGQLVYPNTAYCHHAWLSDDKSLLYVNDELDELNDPDVATTTTYTVDVSDLENPTYLGSFTNGLPAIDHNPMGRDGYLYEANYRSGLRIWDVREPGEETEVAWFDSYPDDDAASFNGAWGVYTGLPSGTILVSDIERGLFVLRATVIGVAETAAETRILLRGAPNPFRGATTLRFSLRAEEPVLLDLHTPSGRRVARLLDGTLGPGDHVVPVNLDRLPAGPAASGVLFARLRIGTRITTERLVLVE